MAQEKQAAEPGAITEVKACDGDIDCESWEQPVGAGTGFCAFVWTVAFLWSLIPGEYVWWNFPAYITGLLIGIGVGFAVAGAIIAPVEHARRKKAQR